MFYYSRDRGAKRVEAHLAHWSVVLQADAHSGYNELYAADREPGPILEAACWAHARRSFVALVDIEASARRKTEGKVPTPISPLAFEIVRRTNRLFEIECAINAAERCLRVVALGRKSWLFAGSDRGGLCAAAMYSLIVTAKLNEIDPHAWLADVLARIASHPASRLDELLPRNWRAAHAAVSQAA
jgi:hypothetical protein